MNFWDVFKAILMLLAGLGTFLVGLKIMGENLENLAGNNLKSLFAKISNNKFLGIATGCGTTIITQSSSATTVMVVGFVNTGAMTLLQATSIIMGANIGTTVTAYLIALQNLPVSAIFAFMACVGAFMCMTKNDKINNIGTILTGVGILFVGLSVMSSSMSSITQLENAQGEKVVEKILIGFADKGVLLLLIGMILTAVIQSSAATTSILVGLCASGAMGLEPALYVTLGMNIGTCITAILASIGASTNAKRASAVHLLFNVIGTLIFSIILFSASKYIIKGLDFLFAGSNGKASDVIGLKIAVFHTVFNVTTTLLMLPLMKQLTQLATLIVPDKKGKNDAETKDKFTYIDDRLLNTPSIAMAMLRKEIALMAVTARENLDLSLNAILNLDLSKAEEFKNREHHIDYLNKEITKYLVKVSHQEISFENEQEIAAYYHNISDIERIGDYAENVIEYTEDLIAAKVDFTPDCKAELIEMQKALYNLFDRTLIAFEKKTLKDRKEIMAYEDLTDTYFNELSQNHIIRLNQGVCKAESASSFISLIGNLERIGDHIMNIVNSMQSYVKEPIASPQQNTASMNNSEADTPVANK